MVQDGPPPVPDIWRFIAAALVLVDDLVSCHDYKEKNTDMSVYIVNLCDAYINYADGH